MKLFLADITLKDEYFGGYRFGDYNDRLIQAETEEQAKEKAMKLFQPKGEEKVHLVEIPFDADGVCYPFGLYPLNSPIN